MEQENQTANTSAEQSAPAPASSGASGDGQTFDRLLSQSPKLSPLAGWLKCLRKPALSMDYSFRKRHVPDLDNDTQGAGHGGGQGNQGSAHPSGQNSDTMNVNGGFTIRYFDFALGIVGLAVASCMIKGCCCLKRKMR